MVTDGNEALTVRMVMVLAAIKALALVVVVMVYW